MRSRGGKHRARGQGGRRPQVRICAPSPEGERIVKYGAPIGVASRAIDPGEYVHTHNMASDYLPDLHARRRAPFVKEVQMINAYLRTDGRKGIRNDILVAYLVECAHHVAREIVHPFREPRRAADRLLGLLSQRPTRTR